MPEQAMPRPTERVVAVTSPVLQRRKLKTRPGAKKAKTKQNHRQEQMLGRMLQAAGQNSILDKYINNKSIRGNSGDKPRNLKYLYLSNMLVGKVEAV